MANKCCSWWWWFIVQSYLKLLLIAVNVVVVAVVVVSGAYLFDCMLLFYCTLCQRDKIVLENCSTK